MEQLSLTSTLPNDQSSIRNLILRYSIGCLMVFTIIVSIVGNIMVCVAICIERRLRKICNWFLISLAMADLFVGLLVMSFSLAYDLLGEWIFGEFLCRIWISFDVMCCTASILNLCAISTDRFLHIKDPYNYDNYMGRKVVILTIVIIWLLSAVISFLPLSLGWHKASFSHTNLSFNDKNSTVNFPINNFKQLINLDENHSNHKKTNNSLLEENYNTNSRSTKCDLGFSPLYAVISSCISFYLPCIIMVALYTRLYLYARKHVQDIRKICLLQHQPAAINKSKQCDQYAIVDKQTTKIKTQLCPENNAQCNLKQTIISDVQQTSILKLNNLNEEDKMKKNFHKKETNNRKVGFVVTTTKETAKGNKSMCYELNQKLADRNQQQIVDHKAAITIGIIMGTFLFCWVPFFFTNIVVSFCQECVPSTVFQLLTWLGWTNSAINPIIYSIFNREFRSAFHRILTTWPRGKFCLFEN